MVHSPDIEYQGLVPLSVMNYDCERYISIVKEPSALCCTGFGNFFLTSREMFAEYLKIRKVERTRHSHMLSIVFSTPSPWRESLHLISRAVRDWLRIQMHALLLLRDVIPLRGERTVSGRFAWQRLKPRRYDRFSLRCKIPVSGCADLQSE